MEVEAAAGSAIASEDRTVAGALTSTIEIKDDFTVNDSFKQEWIHLLCQKGIGNKVVKYRFILIGY